MQKAEVGALQSAECGVQNAEVKRKHTPCISFCTLRSALCVLLFIGLLPLLVKFFQRLWLHQQYQFFPLMLFGAVWIGWERVADLPAGGWRRGGPGGWGVAGYLFLMGYLVLVGGNLFYVRSAAEVSLILLVMACCWRAGGGELVRLMAGPIILLCIIIPPPGHLDEGFTLELQNWAVRLSGRVLDLVGVANVRAGNTLEIPGRRLLVQEACSGINSLMSVVAFAVLFGLWRRRSFLRIAVLLPVAVFFVLWGNVLRISLEAWLKVRWGIDVLEGSAHELLGLGLFLGCAGLVVSFDVLVGLCFGVENRRAGPPAKRGEEGEDRPVGDPFSPRWVVWGVAGLFAVTGVFSEIWLWNAWPAARLPEDARFVLPAKLGEWQQVSNGSLLMERPQTTARVSHVWVYRRGEMLANLAIDFPFPGYHELSFCYSMSGWTVNDERPDASRGGLFTRVRMRKDSGDGYLLFSQVDEQGHWVGDLPLDYSGWDGALRLVRQNAISTPTYQVQTLVQSGSDLSALQQMQVDDLFLAARQQLARQINLQLEGK